MVVSNIRFDQQVDGNFPSAASPGSISIRLITADELARELLFNGPTSAFRAFCKKAGIKPLPGRKDCYDPVAVRHRLNEVQGLGNNVTAESALTRSRVRRNG